MNGVLLALTFVLADADARTAEPQPVPTGRLAGWYTDFAAAQREARRTGRPLLVAFA